MKKFEPLTAWFPRKKDIIEIKKYYYKQVPKEFRYEYKIEKWRHPVGPIKKPKYINEWRLLKR